MLLGLLRSQYKERLDPVYKENDREVRLQTGKKMSPEEKCNLNSVPPQLLFFSRFFFLSAKNAVSQYWLLVELNNAERILHSHLRRKCGPAVCPWAKGSLFCVVGKAGPSLSAYLGLHLRGKCFHFGRTVITRATDLNWNRLPCQPPQPMSSTALGWSQRWGTFSVSYSEK